ncbi:histidinol-phosphate transaminase [Rubeoparvulum massiliense]|uniref:histidinol-phosphate transaminase n=1 Tax=Rubeoparvulum massiliense TaxID=1631346 RepID=UPI00065E8EAD|nr:histidinol-phosphate transaminase [Rubeoparvulum massiliense]
MKVRSELTQVQPYQPGKPMEELRRELGLSHVIKLASNENPYGCSDHVKRALEAEIQMISRYPDGAAYQLKQAIAEYYGVTMEEIIVGSGSDELIGLVARTFLQPGTATVMATPTFSQYKWNATLQGADVVEVSLKNGTHDLSAMLAAITLETRVIWICNPNNPTGTYVNHQAVEQFLQQVPAHVLVVLDEAYAEYVTAEDYPESAKLLATYENLLILRTFSKIYGLASLRVAYGIGSSSLLQWLERVREPFNTSRFAQAAAVEAIRDQVFVDRCRKVNKQERDLLQARLEALKWRIYPSQTNFLLIQLSEGDDDLAWFDYLLHQGIIIRPGTPIQAPGTIRISVGLPEENQRVLQVIEQRRLPTSSKME